MTWQCMETHSFTMVSMCFACTSGHFEIRSFQQLRIAVHLFVNISNMCARGYVDELAVLHIMSPQAKLSTRDKRYNSS